MQHTFTVHGHDIIMYLDSVAAQTSAGLSDRFARLDAALHLLPVEHIRLIVEPIIVVDKFPRGRRRGGGWFPNTSTWTTPEGFANTTLDPSILKERVGGRLNSGIIGITTAAFLLDEDWGGGHPAHEYTLLHEVAHSIDHHTSLIPPPILLGRDGHAPYQGQRYDGGSIGELAAEAYSRFFLRGSSMCRGGNGTPPCFLPDGSPATGKGCGTQRRCSARMQRDLQNTLAFRLTTVHFPLARLETESGAGGNASRYASNTGAVRGPLTGTPGAGVSATTAPGAGWRRPGPPGERTG